MTIALELHGIRKSFVAGAGSCRASARVLNGIDLVVRAGEIVVILGPAGSGKSTLLLCAAGLLTPDAGDRRWFGDTSRAGAVRRALYHANAGDLLRSGCVGEAHLHVVDVAVGGAGAVAAEDWMRQRCERGDAVLLSSRDDVVARRLGARAFVLRSGQLQSLAPQQARVAEFVDRSFQHV